MIDFLNFNKKSKDPTKLRAEKPDEDFIPYVCHYDPKTILTKNGELLQIIRITGFGKSGDSDTALRDAIRNAIHDKVKNENFAFWFHTIRRKKNITSGGEFDEFFAKKIDEDWVQHNDFSKQYVNELYITIIVEGLDTSITNFKTFLKSFFYSVNRKSHKDYLKEAHKKLTILSADILADLHEYGAKLMGIVEWDGVIYSEPMRFFGKIVNLYEERYPLPLEDLSTHISSHKIAFGNRELEVVGYNNKNFAAMLSLKEYSEASLAELDKFMQLPIEFIISQSFDFSFNKKDLAHHKHQDYILHLSNDIQFRDISGIGDFVDSDTGKAVDYGKMQTTFMIISKTHHQMEIDVKNAIEQLSSFGYAIIREDIFLEHCFWSQLPGNFNMLRRQKIINTLRVGGFATFQNVPSGSIAGNYWGPAISVFKTVLHTPYFFNFHEGKIGHTLITGELNSGKTVMTNFLVAQSRRVGGRLFYFDFGAKSKCFFRALNGKYYDFDGNDEEVPHFNPLALVNDVAAKPFLIEWFSNLVISAKDHIPPAEIALMPQIIEEIIDAKLTVFSEAIEFFNNRRTANIYSHLQIWNNKKLINIFNQNEIDWHDVIMGFNFSVDKRYRFIYLPIIEYIFYRIESMLDGSPTVMVVGEVFDRIYDDLFAEKIKSFLLRLADKNCVVIMSCSTVSTLKQESVITNVISTIPTRIFLPNKDPHSNYQTMLNLDNEEINILKVLESKQRHFMLTHGDESIIASLDLSFSKEIVKMLSANQMTVSVMDEVILHLQEELGSDSTQKIQPEVWITKLLEILAEIQRELDEEQAKAIREARIASKKIAYSAT